METKVVRLKMFTVEIFTATEDFVFLRGFSYAIGGIYKVQTSWYPFEEYARKIVFFAPNRTKAAKQLELANLHVRNGTLSDGVSAEVPACVLSEFLTRARE